MFTSKILKASGGWFIVIISNKTGSGYLHPDGNIYPYCGLSGYFYTKAYAESALFEYNNKGNYLPDRLFEI